MGFAHMATWSALARHRPPSGENLSERSFPCRKVTFETKYGLCGTKYGSFLGLRMTPFLDPSSTWERPGAALGSWESWESRVSAGPGAGGAVWLRLAPFGSFCPKSGISAEILGILGIPGFGCPGAGRRHLAGPGSVWLVLVRSWDFS